MNWMFYKINFKALMLLNIISKLSLQAVSEGRDLEDE
jgi:hypothetical protein